jgi:hypothetical protein
MFVGQLDGQTIARSNNKLGVYKIIVWVKLKEP